MKPDMQQATCALNLWLLAHEDLVAIEVFTLHPRASRARLEAQESVATALLAHYRFVIRCLGQL